MEIIFLDKKICQVEQKLNCFMTKRRSEEGIEVRQRGKYRGANIPKLHFHRKGESIVFLPVREGFLSQHALPPPLIAAYCGD